jgi:polyvinyl alcohol dehydrogenase (cytochrome)
MNKTNLAFLCVFSVAATLLSSVAHAAEEHDGAHGANWVSAGGNLRNSRNAAHEERIGVKSVSSLSAKWSYSANGDMTATPAVEGNFLYFPDAAGFLHKVNRKTGALIWKFPISSYTGIDKDFARATPAIAGDALILGNQNGKQLEMYGQLPAPQGAKVFAVDKHSGKLLWMTQVDKTARSMVTQSAIIAKGMAYVGVASNEELVAAIVTKAPPNPTGNSPTYFGNWTWNFRGSVVALDVKTGAIKWTSYTVPEGYFGGSVWGSTGAADLKRNQLYVTTGDNFWIPDSALACAAEKKAHGKDMLQCMAPDDYFDSIVAMDLDTGKIKWGKRGLPYDTWNVGCGLFVPGFTFQPNDNCPNPKGPDWDFGQGAILMGDGDDAIVGAGQKSGVFWAFKASNGALAWKTEVAPGGLTGGLQWGSAYDGERVYVAVANAGPIIGAGVDAQPWKLKDGSTTTAGGWAALDAKSGKVLWTTKDPLGGRAEGPVSIANGVVFGCNIEYNPANPALGAGHYYALNAKTGAPLWNSPTTGSCIAGPAIVKGMVYWGNGAGRSATPNTVYGFGLPGSDGDD